MDLHLNGKSALVTAEAISEGYEYTAEQIVALINKLER